jgi:two-component system cell cycle response regulator DivK
MRKEIKALYDFTGKTILVADDLHINFILLEAFMEGTNARLIWAKDGKEAVEVCLSQDFIDLILMDLEMPGMNGIEATRKIKKFRKEIPVIAQTAFEAFFNEDEILHAGCSQIISKPLMPEFLLDTIAKYLKKEK